MPKTREKPRDAKRHAFLHAATRGVAEPARQRQTTQSKLRAQYRSQQILCFLAERAICPFLKCHAARPFEVIFKHRRLPGGHGAVVNVQVGLVVQPERPTVEIGRAKSPGPED